MTEPMNPAEIAAMAEMVANLLAQVDSLSTQLAAVTAERDAAVARGMLKAIAVIDANASPCVPPPSWEDGEINAYRCGQIDASISFVHAIRAAIAEGNPT